MSDIENINEEENEEIEEVAEKISYISTKLSSDTYNILKNLKEEKGMKSLSDAVLFLKNTVDALNSRCKEYEKRILDLEAHNNQLKQRNEELEEIARKYDAIKDFEDFSWINEAIQYIDVPGEEIAKEYKTRGQYNAAVLAVMGGWDDNSIKSMLKIDDNRLYVAKIDAFSRMIDDYVEHLKEQYGIIRRETRVITKAEPIDLQDIQNVRASPIVNIYYSLAKTEYKNKTGKELLFETFIEECVIYTMNRKGYYLTFVTPSGEVYE